MTNGEILEKLFPGFEEIQVFSEYILRNGKETIIKVDREFWESEMREATPEERKGIDKYINSIAEACEDCISRQEAIACCRNEWEEEVEDRLRALPSVTPAEKVGHWEYVQYDGNPNIGNWHCSECNRIVCGAITAVNPVYSYKYCPECGVKMQEVKG